MKGRTLLTLALLASILITPAVALQVKNSYSPLDSSECYSERELTGEKPNRVWVIKSHCWNFQSRLTVPEDMKLINQDGFVVGDEICIGERVKFQSISEDSEYEGEGGECWNECGYEDSPPIYWVDDIVEAAKDVMGCTNRVSSTSYVDGFKTMMYPSAATASFSDAKSKVFYTYQRTITMPLYGNLACAIKEKDMDVKGSSWNGQFFEANKVGTIDFDVSFDVQCFYYHNPTLQPVNPGKLYGPLPNYQGELDLGVPSVPQFDVDVALSDLDLTDPDLTQEDINDHINEKLEEFQREYAERAANGLLPLHYSGAAGKQQCCEKMRADWFYVGTIRFTKEINVVERGKPGIDFTVIGADELEPDQEKLLTVVVENTGSLDLNLDSVSCNVEHRFIVCDDKTVSPGEEAECIISVTPKFGELVKLRVLYDYIICGRDALSSSSKALGEVESIRPEGIAQVYSMGVHGSCENSYYSCSSAGVSGSLFAGYKCYKTESGYYTPANQRLDLKFNLTRIPENVEIIGAWVYLKVDGVDVTQSADVYGLQSDDWVPLDCKAGGDICTRPYCGECEPLYEAEGTKLASFNVAKKGKYMIDVSRFVSDKYANGESAVSFQIRGLEDVWKTEGAISCNKSKDWETQHVVYAAAGESGPYMEVAYKKKK